MSVDEENGWMSTYGLQRKLVASIYECSHEDSYVSVRIDHGDLRSLKHYRHLLRGVGKFQHCELTGNSN